ncbi:Hsp70 family protein [uncultured Treponema sp.]|uniref:right-handed parallel beta-helix repeat-containing protein n=1 Tax=uncultured Treponema sp. TaxID=162155 RepID=UPI0025E9A663|nr:Hsp70 family protein [uncultured Treponema sp.]
MVCANCGHYFNDGYDYDGIKFCSVSCFKAFEAKTAPQTQYVSGPDYSSEISSMQSELNSLRQEQAERQQQEVERRQQEEERRQQEEKRRQEEEERRRQEEEERRRQEEEQRQHLGKCAWCGKQNEQVYMNQLLFPARKFCSKKCLFDAKSAENPTASDKPHITAQGTGNVYTSIKEAFEWSKDGDTLVFTKGVFEIPEFTDFNNDHKGFNIKAENNDMNLPLSERTVFKIQRDGLYIYANSSLFIDGIVFDGVNKKGYGFFNGIYDALELVVKNCVFMNLDKGTVGESNSIFENCLFINCNYGFSSVIYYYNSIPQIKFSKCTFDSVKYALSYGGPKAQLYDSVLKNSLPNPLVDVPSNNAKNCNMRTNKTYSYLQAAIDDAQDGDTIMLAPGEHHGGFVIVNKRNLTIKAAVTNLSAGESQLSAITDCHRTVILKSQNITFEGIVFNTPRIQECFGYGSDKKFIHNVKFSGCRFIGLEDGFKEYAALENCEISDDVVVKWSVKEFERYLDWIKVSKTNVRHAPYYAIKDCCAYIHVSHDCLTADGKTALSFGTDSGTQYYKVLSAGSNDKAGSIVFSNPADNQTVLSIRVYAALRNETKSLTDCTRLGMYDFTGIPKMPKGTAKFSIHFEVVNNHWLKLWVTEDNGKVTTAIQEIPNALKLKAGYPVAARF